MSGLDRDPSLRSSVSRPLKTPRNQHARTQREIFEVDEDLQRLTQTSSFKPTPSSSSFKATTNSNKASSSAKRSFLTTSTATSFLFPSTPTPSAKPTTHILSRAFLPLQNAEHDEVNANLISSFSSPILERQQGAVGLQDEMNKKRKLSSLVLGEDDIEIMSSPALTDADLEDTVYDHEAELRRTSVIVLEEDVEEDDDLPTVFNDNHDDDLSSPSIRKAAYAEGSDSVGGLAAYVTSSTPPLQSTALTTTRDTVASTFKPLPSFSEPSPKTLPSFSMTQINLSLNSKRTIPLPTKPIYVLPTPRSPSSSRTVNQLSRTPLPSMDWSPSHRRRRSTNAKYKAGGLAATTLGWVFDAQDAMLRANTIFTGLGISTQSDKQGNGSVMAIVVREVRKEDTYVAVMGVVKSFVGDWFEQVEQVGTLLRVLLISDDKNVWAGKVLLKSEVGLGGPISEVNLNGETWKMAINWRVLNGK